MPEAYRMVATVNDLTCELEPDRGTWQCTDKYGLPDPFTELLLRNEFEWWITQASPEVGGPVDFAFEETIRVFKGKVTIHTDNPEDDEGSDRTRIF